MLAIQGSCERDRGQSGEQRGTCRRGHHLCQKGVHHRPGLFLFDGSAYHEVAMGEETPPGTDWYFVGFGATFINSTDRIAFGATLGAGASARREQARHLPRRARRDLKTIVLTGEAAPGSGTYSSLSIRGLADDGDVVFFANVQDLQGYRAFFHWDSTDGHISLIAKQGGTAPGTGLSPT